MADVSHLKKEIAEVRDKMFAHLEEERTRSRKEAARQQLEFLGCKLCQGAPKPPIMLATCCNRIFGCETCFQNYIEKHKYCPLCENEVSSASALPIRGLDEPCALLN